jgi:hypothetical protein
VPLLPVRPRHGRSIFSPRLRPSRREDC